MQSETARLSERLKKLWEDVRFAPAEGGAEVNEAKDAAYKFIAEETKGLLALFDRLDAVERVAGEMTRYVDQHESYPMKDGGRWDSPVGGDIRAWADELAAALAGPGAQTDEP